MRQLRTLDRRGSRAPPVCGPAEAGRRGFRSMRSNAELSPLRRVYGVARDRRTRSTGRAPASSRATWSSCGGRSGANAVRSTCWCSGISTRSSNWWRGCCVIRPKPRTWPRRPSSRPTGRSVPSAATARSTPGCIASRSIPRAMRWPRASAGRSITRPSCREGEQSVMESRCGTRTPRRHRRCPRRSARRSIEAVEQLPEDLRTAIILREVEGLSYEEIAEAMDCPVGTVRSRIFRAREAIDRSLKPLLD